MPGNTDPYTYPGTDTLRNIPGLRDPQRLASFEANATVARLVELDVNPIKGQFDVSHLRAIHRYIFQDVYEWAGEVRTVNISKHGTLFGAAAFVETALDAVLRRLPDEKYLRATGMEPFALRAGYYLGEINAAHSFREGNGRAQREFIRELGSNAGFEIDWGRVTQRQMIAASRESFATGDSESLAALIRVCIKAAG
jgi:cell filamentation protein